MKPDLLVQSEHIDAQSSRLAWFAKQREECRTLGQNGSSRIDERFGFTNKVKTYDDVFQQVLRNKGLA